MAIVGAITAVVGTAASISAQQKAAATQEKMAEQQQRQQELAYRRQQIQAIREAQIRRAQGLATAQAAGVGTTSLVGGGIGSIGSQLGSTLGYSSQQSGISQNISRLGIQANNQLSLANMFGNVADIGSSVFQFSGGPERLRNWLGG